MLRAVCSTPLSSSLLAHQGTSSLPQLNRSPFASTIPASSSSSVSTTQVRTSGPGQERACWSDRAVTGRAGLACGHRGAAFSVWEHSFSSFVIGGELPTVASLRDARKMQAIWHHSPFGGREELQPKRARYSALTVKGAQTGQSGGRVLSARVPCPVLLVPCCLAGCWRWCQPYLRSAAQIARWEGSHLPAGWAACVPGDRAWSFVRSSQREVFYREERVSFTAPVLRSSFRPLGSEMGLGRFQLSSETSKKIFLTLSQDQAGFKSQEEKK